MMIEGLSGARFNRRKLLAGSAAVAAVAGTPFGGMPAWAISREPVRARRKCEPTLAKYLCNAVHQPMARQLDAVIADPHTDWEETQATLDAAHCPGCGKKVHPVHEHLAVVQRGGRHLKIEGGTA